MVNNPNSPFQSVIGLGAQKAEYHYGGAGKWLSLILGIVFVLACPALALLAAWLGYDANDRFGSRAVLGSVAGPLVIGLALLVIGAAMLFQAWRNWSLAAGLYDKGLAFRDRQGIRQVAWTDVEAVWQNVTRHYTNGVYTGTTHVYTLKVVNGQKVVLDDRLGKKVEELGREIQQNVSSALFPRYWQALQSGQKVAFGPLALDRTKLYAGKKELSWDEIKAIRVDKGAIAVRKDKGWLNWASATVAQVPNFFIFYELIGRLAKIE